MPDIYFTISHFCATLWTAGIMHRRLGWYRSLPSFELVLATLRNQAKGFSYPIQNREGWLIKIYLGFLLGVQVNKFVRPAFCLLFIVITRGDIVIKASCQSGSAEPFNTNSIPLSTLPFFAAEFVFPSAFFVSSPLRSFFFPMPLHTSSFTQKRTVQAANSFQEQKCNWLHRHP